MSKQIQRLRSQDLFQMEKKEQSKFQDKIDGRGPNSEDTLPPEVKKVVEEKQKILNMQKKPIIMPSSGQTMSINTSNQGLGNKKGNFISTTQPNPKLLKKNKKGNLSSTTQPNPKFANKNKNRNSGSTTQPNPNLAYINQKGNSGSTTQPNPTVKGAQIPTLSRERNAPQQKQSLTGKNANTGPPIQPNKMASGFYQNIAMPGPPMQSNPNLPVQTNFHQVAPMAGPPMQSNQMPVNVQQIPGDMQAWGFASPRMGGYVIAPGPKGVPRSFLKQSMGASSIQPQSFEPAAPVFPQINTPMFQTFDQSQLYPQSQMYAPYGPGPSEAHAPPVALAQTAMPSPSTFTPNTPTFIPTSTNSEVYTPFEEITEGSESPDNLEPGQKRLSAFQRLGPLNIDPPKKPKLTINLKLNQDTVREVVGEKSDKKIVKHVPVHSRKDILQSKEEIVVTFLDKWPWKKPVNFKKKPIGGDMTKVVQEQLLEPGYYDKDQDFIQITVKGYPSTWTKEDVLDAILEALKGKSFIPSFIEFSSESCMFLVLKCRAALYTILKMGFLVRKDEVELRITVAVTYLSTRQLAFLPRVVLRKMLSVEKEKMCLKAFTLQSDISHFIYFPLQFLHNQADLIQLPVVWDKLTELDLSHNKLCSIEGLDLPTTTLNLKRLDLSHNRLDGIHCILQLRSLPLQTIKLEGNPMCHNYTDPDYYIKVLRMLFPEIKEIDGVSVARKGQFPMTHQYYCPDDAQPVVDKLLSIFFPLLDGAPEDRAAMEDLYEYDAVLTITFRYKLRYSPGYRNYRNLFLRSRILEEEEMESIVGGSSISKLLTKWPDIQHDPASFTVDVLHHNERSTVIRIGGILKVTSESLAEDEHMLHFTRTLVLRNKGGVEYKIQNELLYWDMPEKHYLNHAFQLTTARLNKFTLKLEPTPDDGTKKQLVEIFAQLTDLDINTSERCLEQKDWNIKSALEYFIKLLKLDGFQTLNV